MIDLNCDMGEGIGNDEAIMPHITSANIACGYHAGDEFSIRKTIKLCIQHNVAIGAHPGFADKENFGRIPMSLSHEELYQLITEQLNIMKGFCDEFNTKLHHIKPHGALYNMAASNEGISKVIAQAVLDFNPELVFYGLSGSMMIIEAKKVGLKTANEVFADRTYLSDGTLTPRTNPNALIQSVEEAVNQVLQIVKNHYVSTLDGNIIPMSAETICIHGDGDHAVDIAIALNKIALSSGFTIKNL